MLRSQISCDGERATRSRIAASNHRGAPRPCDVDIAGSVHQRAPRSFTMTGHSSRELTYLNERPREGLEVGNGQLPGGISVDAASSF